LFLGYNIQAFVKPNPALPINTKVVYLVIAGIAIGIFALKKSKAS